MDRRLPHRIQEVRRSLHDKGLRTDSVSVLEELKKTYSDYKRMKDKPLKRFIAQELSTPVQAATGTVPAKAVTSAAEGVDCATCVDAEESGRAKNKRKRQREQTLPVAGVDASRVDGNGGALGTTDEHAESAQHDSQERSGGDHLNNSLRRLYNPQAASAGDADKNENGEAAVKAGSESAAAARQRSLRQRKAIATMRKELGLPEPTVGGTGSSFSPLERPEERLEDLGGIDGILNELRQLVVHPLTHPEVYAHLGVRPPTGVLLHGPPGSGKTKLAHALAGSTGVNFFKVAATEIVSGMSGESEAKIRQLFQAAMESAPSLIFLDEVDAITPRRDSAGREMERRIVAQLLTCLDDLQNSSVVVMGATNRPDALDPALRRAGRFDREIAMGIPDEAARARILAKMTTGMRLAGDLDLTCLAKMTPGFVGADLYALAQEAALTAVTRAFVDMGASTPASNDEAPTPYTPQQMAGLAVGMDDFTTAHSRVQPSARREGFTTIPDVSWDEVGALGDVRTDLDNAVCEPIRKAELFRHFGLTVPSGVLLFGPPGCGKTLLAKATANASGANFIAIKGPELLNKYVGESERAVRLVFQRAASSAPCVIFFDELDALVPKRSGEGSGSSERVVNQMLTEMDGVQQRAQVYVIAATNRPDIVDPAMLRPGRLDRLLYVPLPSEAGRLEIIRAHTKKLPLADDVDLAEIANEADGFSGADLAALVREAAMIAIRMADVPPTATQTAATAVKTDVVGSPSCARAALSTAVSMETSQLISTATSTEAAADTAMRVADSVESDVAGADHIGIHGGIGAQVAPATNDGLVADITMVDEEIATSANAASTDVALSDVVVATSAAPITAGGVDIVAPPAATASTNKAEERSASGDTTAASTSSVQLTAAIFAEARSKVSASVGPQERRDYLALAERIKSGRSGS